MNEKFTAANTSTNDGLSGFGLGRFASDPKPDAYTIQGASLILSEMEK